MFVQRLVYNPLFLTVFRQEAGVDLEGAFVQRLIYNPVFLDCISDKRPGWIWRGLSYRDLFTTLCFLTFFRQEAGVDLVGTFIRTHIYKLLNCISDRRPGWIWKGRSFRDTTLCFWLFFRQEAGVDLEGTFVQRLVYDDSVSYDLVTAAEKVLGKFGYCSYIWKTFLLRPIHTSR